MIDKYLGDGFLAYWRDGEGTSKHVANVIELFKQAQSQNHPRFRIALHLGPVAIGGIPSMGEESLMGKDVNFVFRIGKARWLARDTNSNECRSQRQTGYAYLC